MFYFAPLSAPQAVAAIAEAAASNGESLKKNLKWKMQHTPGMPSMPTLTLPTVTAEDDIYMDPRLAMSPNLPGGAAGFMPPNILNPAAAAVAAFGLAACHAGGVLERLGPHILRSHIPTAQYKPIPHNDGIDLEQFRRKDPREWNMDDVIGWLIQVAKKHGIPVEDMNMHRFANCTGPLLTLMTQQNFIERDPTYGGILYMEFRKLMGDESSSFLDDWIRAHREELGPSTSGMGNMAAASNVLLSSLAAASEAMATASSFYDRMPPVNSDQPSTSSQAPEADDVFGRPSSFSQRESVIKAAGSSTVGPPSSFAAASIANLGSLPDLRKLNGGRYKLESDDNHCKGAPFDFKFGDSSTGLVGGGISNGASVSTSSIPKFPDGKIKKKFADGACTLTISGKPRKRSQHTRGNKLWEFIRSALRDPRFCPTVVKWEDEREGVFRIVESEKLARLWGEKKNNQKMTYEKLSRAMRTYYEKQILVPVPKTGLYPKKLVYKFGPNAKGWQLTNVAPIQSSTISKTSRPNNIIKTTKLCNAGQLLANGTTSSVPFPVRPVGIGPAKDDSAAVVAAANGLMSLAHVASCHLAASAQETGDRKETDEAIDVDGHSVTGDCVSAIEETLVNEDDGDDDFSQIDDGNDRDTPPALVA